MHARRSRLGVEGNVTQRSITTGSAARKPPSPNLVLAIVSLGIFMTVLDLFIVNIAFPNIERDFTGSSLSSLSWILNGYAIVFAALLVPAGRIADRFGQKRVFVSGLALFTLASVLCAAATSVPFLIIARVIQAAGAAAVTPTSLALLLTAMPAEKRTWALGIWTAVGGVGAAAGPTVGGLLVSANWRWVFLVNLPIGIVTTLVASRTLTEQRNDAKGTRPDLLGSLLLIFSVGALSLGIVQGPDWGWGSPKVIGTLLVTLVSMLGFGYRSTHHPSPIVEPALIKVRTFSASSISALLFNASFSILLLGLVQFLTGVWGYSALKTGLAISPGPLMVPLIAPRSQLVVRRLGAMGTVLLGTTLFGVAGLFWYVQTGVEPNYLAEILPGLVIGGIGFGMALPVLIGTAVRSLPAERFATGSAVVTMARQIGTVLGISVLIVILDSAGRDIISAFHQGWLVMAGLSFAAGASALFLRRGASQPSESPAMAEVPVVAGD
jgi:EmrB/QacA subfamily drug resistance transporter